MTEHFKGALSGQRKVLAAESSLQMLKNAFYFTLKALFIFKIFKFLSLLFGHVKKRLDKKVKVNFKIFGITNLEKTIAIHILTNILRSKGNHQLMKFGQLIEYNTKNIFLKKSTQKVMEVLSLYAQ